MEVYLTSNDLKLFGYFYRINELIIRFLLLSYLFLSVEDAKNLLDAGISELMTAYEEIIGENLENIKKPLLIFLDEIQSDPQWAIALKSLFEKTKLVFFCGTGSSAVTLQTTSNLARRAIFETMPPICFTEYEMIRSKIDPKKGLKENDTLNL